jgi:hypothetical protein
MTMFWMIAQIQLHHITYALRELFGRKTPLVIAWSVDVSPRVRCAKVTFAAQFLAAMSWPEPLLASAVDAT